MVNTCVQVLDHLGGQRRGGPGWNENTTKNLNLDFSGGPAVKNLPGSAGHMGLIPGLGRSHRALQQRGLRTTATEAAVWGPRAERKQQKPLDPGARAPQQEKPAQ